MARKTKTNLTFQVTLRDLEGVKIPEVREFIKNALEFHRGQIPINHPLVKLDMKKATVHLTNKETSYA